MKNIDYEGSLVDDIRVIQQQPDSYEDLEAKNKEGLIIVILVDLFWLIICFLARNIATFASLVSATTVIYAVHNSSIMRKRTFKQTNRMNIITKILQFVFRDKMKETKELFDSLTYDSLENAVLIEVEKTEPNKDPKEGITSRDLDDYIRCITTDIYYLDINNQIKALREVKNVMCIPNTEVSFTKDAKLFEFEEQDYPEKLPVEKVLELK
ncbi:MAG: hypothetical protein J1F35_07105 [Erysipelotrichales bacterium]|nr:hypothetical protein [Erysipelotrichales bacterium]